MKAVFRVDASLQIGSGHVMRCLTLAEALRAHGAQCHFISRAHPGHLLELIRKRGFAVNALPAELSPPPANTQVVSERPNEPAHAPWLGSDWQTDAEETGAIVESLRPDWLVVDHYALDQQWETALRPWVDRIMVIDDLADRRHDCDLLLDQNMVAHMHTRYVDKVPAACGLLLGPKYALLQPIYAELHNRIPPRESQIQRIFIFFGGADRDNLTGRSLAAFMSLNRPDIEVDVVIADNCPHAETISHQVVGHGNIHLYSSLPTLATLMVKADLAIGAGGATSWERLCLGLPTLVVTLAENQRPIADGLSQGGLIRLLGHQDVVDHTTIAQALGKLLQKGLDEDWSLRCLSAVDGKGIDRVCAALTVTATTRLRVRHARLDDKSMLLEWVNEPSTRDDAFSPKLISAEIFRNWFHARLRDLESCRLYLVETEDSVPVGHVRFDHADQMWSIEYAISPHFRGSGLGPRLLEAALLTLREEESGALVLGQMKDNNQPSCQVFETLAFGAQINEGGRWNIGVCSDKTSWINAYIPEMLFSLLAEGHQVSWAHDAAALPPGDICFYLSYGRIVAPELLARYKNNLVVHESDLPKGRGWSPLTWQVLEGRNEIQITLLEAALGVDSGDIYLTDKMTFDGTELVKELRTFQAEKTISLCKKFALNYPESVSWSRPQEGGSTYYPRRSKEDSELDSAKTLREQFNLLRVVDNDKYPAFIKIGGKKFILKIEQLHE
jgi:UDP-2,4-diacetamido-2,4,6-trideoxy-beta-L-altropyranose hydrolase